MATLYMPSVYNPATGKTAKAKLAAGNVRGMSGNLLIPAATAINDTIVFGIIPSHAVLLPTSTLVHGALGGTVTLDIGFAELGSATLASALAVSTAGTKQGMAAVSGANLGKDAWAIAGYTSDPRRNLTLIGTIKGSAVASAANLYQHFQWMVNG